MKKIPDIFATGPSVTFPAGVQPVDMSLSDEDESTQAAPEGSGRQLVRYISKVFQEYPQFFKRVHAIHACFGVYEK